MLDTLRLLAAPIAIAIAYAVIFPLAGREARKAELVMNQNNFVIRQPKASLNVYIVVSVFFFLLYGFSLLGLVDGGIDMVTVKLTRREKEILDLLLGGSSSKDISKALGISNDTVLSHQKSLYRKLGVHSLDELLKKHQPNNGTAPPIPIEADDKSFSLPKFVKPVGVAVIAVLALVFSFLLGMRFAPEKPSDEPTVPNPFIIVMRDNSPYGWLYTMEPDLLIYDNEIRASPFKLGRGNRITEGDIFAIICTFKSNIDLVSMDFAFVNNTAINEEGNWDILSQLKPVQNDIKAGVEYSFGAILSITKTSSNSSGWANTFVIHIDQRTVKQPTLTFTRLDIVRN